MNTAQWLQLLADAEAGADIALPLLGEAELVPVVNAAVSLVNKIATAAQSKSNDAMVAAAMQAGRTAADVQEALKFPKG